MFKQEVREANPLMSAMTLVAGVCVLGGVLLAPLPQERKITMLAAFTGALVLALWMLRQTRVVRVEVDDRELRVGMGWVVDRIPLDTVQSCEAYSYRAAEWGGHGVRMSREGKLYSVTGDHGVAVRLTLKDGRKIHFSSCDPSAVCEAVREAQISRFIEH